METFVVLFVALAALIAVLVLVSEPFDPISLE
jgi:hypothetical protein